MSYKSILLSYWIGNKKIAVLCSRLTTD